MKREVREGILKRHAAVEDSEDKLTTALGQAYLCHLDRAELMAEVEKLKRELREEREDRADERRSGGHYWGYMIGEDL